MYAATLLATIHEGGLGAMTGGGFFGLGAIAGPVLMRFGASIPFPFALVQPWRLVMAIFLHGGLLHIGMNMWVLMDIGPVVEEVYGSARFFFLYVATGIAGFLLSSATGHVSVGGSASLLGLIGVMLAITTVREGAHMKALRGQLIRWLIYIAIFGLVFHGVDNMAHLGGLASGFGLGKLMTDRLPSGPAENRRAQILGWGTTAVVVLSFGLMLWTSFHPS
jgi:rhomboid protease GluP